MAVDTRLDSSSNTLTINISGRFDFGINQDFRKATDQVTSTVKAIIVNMARVDYLDSSALGMLLVLRDKVGESNTAVCIRHSNPDVRKILEIANFDKLFTVD